MDAIEDDYQAGIVRGAASASQHAGVELVCLAGGVVGDADKDHRSLRNFLFELIDPQKFDGVLVLGGSLASQLGVSAFSEWMRRFSGLPMVSLGLELSTCHNIVVDGAPGMKDTLRHLITTHSHRRIAFVRGPVTSNEAEERYDAYHAVLQEFGITEDPRLVLQGTWLRESGAAAVGELLDLLFHRLRIQGLLLFWTSLFQKRCSGFGARSPAKHRGAGHQPVAKFFPGKLPVSFVQLLQKARNHFEFFLIEEPVLAGSSICFRSARSWSRCS